MSCNYLVQIWGGVPQILWLLLSLALPIQAAENPSMPLRALVISNSSYASNALTNPPKDAELMAATLKQLGFSVKQISDLNRKRFYAEVRKF